VFLPRRRVPVYVLIIDGLVIHAAQGCENIPDGRLRKARRLFFRYKLANHLPRDLGKPFRPKRGIEMNSQYPFILFVGRILNVPRCAVRKPPFAVFLERALDRLSPLVCLDLSKQAVAFLVALYLLPHLRGRLQARPVQQSGTGRGDTEDDSGAEAGSR